jgi:hypothetical protein
METSIILALFATVISIIALIQSFIAYKSTVILGMKKELSDKANVCNKFIIPETQGHTSINQEISVIVTQIIYAKDQLKMCYKNHGLLLISYDQKDFIRFFYLQLHTSIIELIKNDLQISNYDSATSPEIEKQHLRCRKFLQSIIDEKKS